MQKTQYTPEEEQRLMTELWDPRIADDPEAYVMFNYPWGVKDTPLEHFSGPRRWQRKILRKIARHIEHGHALNLPRLFRLARSSGRGIGKSALVAWITQWFLDTRIGASAIVSANTEDQLRKITFPELDKWVTMSLNSHWWEVVGISMRPAKWLIELVETQLKKSTKHWGAEGKLWSEEKPDSYAGNHNHDGMMLIFDEASGIPDTIWTVAKGFFTEPTFNRFWFAFSQMRRNKGQFFEIFNKNRDLWDNEQIDARTVEGTDQKAYQDIIDEYGPDSDEARVEVYGLAPTSDEETFIGVDLVKKAAAREHKDDKTAPITMGVDPSGGGTDWFVIVIRQGTVILKIFRFKITDDEKGTMEGVGHIVDHIEEFKPSVSAIDTHLMGGPIADRVNEQGYRIRKVNFSWGSKEPSRWGNKRAEMWAAMKRWLETGVLPADKRLQTDLVGPRKKPDSKNVMWLESKKDMKGRGLASPDTADALALTFAFKVANREYNGNVAAKRTERPARFVGSRAGAGAAGWMKN